MHSLFQRKNFFLVFRSWYQSSHLPAFDIHLDASISVGTELAGYIMASPVADEQRPEIATSKSSTGYLIFWPSRSK
jgi:hypothetical protein